jgi:hypothetical protein
MRFYLIWNIQNKENTNLIIINYAKFIDVYLDFLHQLNFDMNRYKIIN